MALVLDGGHHARRAPVHRGRQIFNALVDGGNLGAVLVVGGVVAAVVQHLAVDALGHLVRLQVGEGGNGFLPGHGVPARVVRDNTGQVLGKGGLAGLQLDLCRKKEKIFM